MADGSCFSYDVLHEGDENILRFDCEKCAFLPSLEDNTITMSKTIDVLSEVNDINRIVYVQKRDYEYEHFQTGLLVEIAHVYKKLIKQRSLFSFDQLSSDPNCKTFATRWHSEIQYLVLRLFKNDPLGAYVELKRTERRERIALDTLSDKKFENCIQKYIQLLNYFISHLEATKLITIAKPHLPGYKIGDRSVYRKIFQPSIKPDFMYTKLMSNFPNDGEEIDSYELTEESDVTIFKFPDSVRYLYHLMPPEFKLSEEQYEILDLARKILAEHKPKRSEFVVPERMREVFFNVGKDLVEELMEYRHYKPRGKEVSMLANILVRYTVGFGLIEVLLSDEKIQDISVNSPYGDTPIYVVHSDYDDCYTNIIPTSQEAESWASKLRMVSGRPLDEANQILDTEIELPVASSRVSVITEPLDPTGLAFSFRRHRDKPWTLPLFMKNKMISPLAAGCLSFLIDGTRTMLIAGTRSSGKSSFLGSMLVEIMRRYRMLTIEDTLELPTNALRKLGYNVQPMKVASALAKGTSEMDASDGIRATLRLGDSALIVGEVRSKEAVALYEAMRVGAAANVVAGTIHSDSPYGVYDRVVNDIGVPKTSFKATDIIIVANPVKSASGMKKLRRVTQITEVRKNWENDPMSEGGFMDLFKYDAKKDLLEPTSDLINGDSEILKNIAGNIKEFAGNWDAVWDNINLRAKIKETLVNYAEQTQDFDLLEAEFVIKCNDRYHNLCDSVHSEVGSLDPKRIFFEWEEWLKHELKKRKKNE